MRRLRIFGGILIILLLIAAFTFIRFNKNTPEETTDPPTEESIVNFPDEESKESFSEDNGIDLEDIEPTDIDGYYVVPVPSDSESTDTELSPRREYRALLTPNDTIYPQDFSTNIAAPSAWGITTGTDTVTVAVIDSGFALDHEDMVGRWSINSAEYGGGKESNGVDDDGNGLIDDWRGWDFAQDDNNPIAGSTNPTGNGVSHGSLTSGMVGATGNNGKGIASINWQVKVLPLQVLTDNGVGYTDDIIAAVNYAIDQGATVISLSLGSNSSDPLLEVALNNIIDSGITVVAAAGNCGDPNTYIINDCDTLAQILYPAKYSRVIAVGASTSTDTRASFSSYGPEVDLIAPGTGIRSPTWTQTNQTTGYSTSANGTSISTPIVSGMVGLLKAVQPSITPDQIADVLKYGIDKVSEMGGANKTNYHGYGRLDAWKSLKFATLPHPDGTLVREDGGTAVYLIEGGQRRLVGSPAVFSSMSYKAEKIRIATTADLNLTSTGDVYFREGTILRGSGAAVYVVDYDAGTPYKRHILSPSAFSTLGYSEADIINVSDVELPAADGSSIGDSSLHPDGTLVRQSGGTAIYLIEDGTRRLVGSPEVMSSYNYTDSKVKIPTSGDMLLATASDLYFNEGTLIKDSNPSVYVIDDNAGTFEKRHVTSPTIFSLLSYTSVSAETYIVPTSALPVADGSNIQ